MSRFSLPSWSGQGRAIVLARSGDALFRFVLFLATARVLAPQEFSLYALLTAALATCQWTLSLGAPRVALYFHARQSREALFAWLYLLAAVATGAVFLLLACWPGIRRALFPEVPPGWLWLGLAPLPFSLLADSLSGALLSAGRARIYGATLWARNLGTGAVLALSLASSNRLLWILSGRLAVQATVALLVVAAVRAKPRWGLVRDFAPGALRYGVPTALADGAVALHRRADVFLLSAFGRTAEIGAYALAYAVAEAFWLLTDSLEAALFVDISKRDAEAARAAAMRAFRIYALLGVAGLLAGLAAGEAVLLLFRGRYPRAAALFPWLMAAAVAWGISRPLFSFFSSRGRVRIALACHVAGLAANVLLNVLWIPLWAATGAAAACLVSYSAESLFFWIAFGGRRVGSPGPGTENGAGGLEHP